MSLPDDVDPLEWAAQKWPGPRWTVELAPGQLLDWINSRPQ